MSPSMTDTETTQLSLALQYASITWQILVEFTLNIYQQGLRAMNCLSVN